MMNLDPWIESQLASERPDVFWSIEVPHATGTLYLADRSVYAGGNLFQGALLSVDDVQSLADPDEKVADVPSMTVVVDGAPRILPSNYQFAHYVNVDPFFQSRLIDAYLNVVGALGNKRVRMFVGVPRRPISRGYDNTTFRLASAMEHYLGKALCRTVKRDPIHYPSLRLADVGRAVPFVVGGSPSSLIKNVRAIMRRPRQASMPVPDPGNTGDATLGRPTINPGVVNETWTLEIVDAGPSEFLETGNYDAAIGGDVVPRAAWAQPFTAPVTGSIERVTVRFKRSATGATATVATVVSLYTDNAGEPGTFIANDTVLIAAGTGYVDFEPGHDNLLVDVVAGSTYWLVAHAWHSASTWVDHMVEWSAKTGTAGGALRGDYATSDDTNLQPTFSNWRDFGNATMVFEIEYSGEPTPIYSVTGTASGAQGLGATGEDYTSPNNRIKIPSSIWSGVPEIGDIWTFTTSVLPAQLVFCETGPTTVSFPITEPGMPGFTWVDIAHAALAPRFEDDTPLGEYTPYPFAHDGLGYVGMIETMSEVTEEREVLGDLRIATFGAASVDEASPMDQAVNLLRRASVPSSLIDFAHYTTTKAALAALGWETGGMVNEAGRDAKSVLLDLAFQSRCRFEWVRDKARFRFIADPPDEPDLVIPKAKVRLRSGTKVPNIRLDQVDSPRIVNVVNLRYRRDWSQSKGSAAYLAVTDPQRDEISIAAWGERLDDAFFLCDFIEDDEVAEMLAAFELRQLAYPKDVGFAELSLDMVKVEPGDVIAFELPE